MQKEVVKALEQKTLNWLRVVVPGAIFVVYAVLLGTITGLFALPAPTVDTLTESVSVIVIGVVYRFTPLRPWINRSYHDRINENIRSRLVSIAGLVDDRQVYTWRRVRRVFYDLIDNDESLKVKGQRVMFNGLLWTSCADMTAIGVLYLGYSLVLVISRVTHADYAAICFFSCAFVGFIGSVKTTERHIELGNEQLDLMADKYTPEIKSRIASLAA